MPVALERYIQEGEDPEGNYDYDYAYEQELQKALEELTGPHPVLLLSLLSGRVVVATEDGLRSDGTTSSPGAQFVKNPMTHGSITLSTSALGHKHLLGIDSRGQIVLDGSNSSEVVHEFELVGAEDPDESVVTARLRARVGGHYCYLAFSEDNLPLHKSCSTAAESKEAGVETVFTIMRL
jgi:hypothetical protein